MNLQTISLSTLGGVLIGLGAAVLLLCTGRLAGISGIVGGLVRPSRGEWGWRATFVMGLLVGGAAFAAARPSVFGTQRSPFVLLAVAGVVVGFGSRLGGGCTSGHGICGLSRLSKRSFVGTFTFMLVGAATVLATRALGIVR